MSISRKNKNLNKKHKQKTPQEKAANNYSVSTTAHTNDHSATTTAATTTTTLTHRRTCTKASSSSRRLDMSHSPSQSSYNNNPFHNSVHTHNNNEDTRSSMDSSTAEESDPMLASSSSINTHMSVYQQQQAQSLHPHDDTLSLDEAIIMDEDPFSSRQKIHYSRNQKMKNLGDGSREKLQDSNNNTNNTNNAINYRDTNDDDDDDDELSIQSNERHHEEASSEHKGDYTTLVYHVPQSFEKTWQKFDDFWISICQKPHQWKIVKMFCRFITFLTAIEIGITTPFVLYALGWDFLATVALYLMISLSVVSQLPKRFIFRKRPHVAGRAVRLSKDHTSSFPSRAVTCAVLYSVFICFAIRYTTRENASANFAFWFWVWPVVIGSFLVTSFARVHLGVHYPSDCLFAVVQAVICMMLGAGLFLLNTVFCPSCHSAKCYAAIANQITLSNMKNVNWLLFSGVTVLMMLIAVITVAVNFFVKFHHVFGMTLPCLAFQLVALCPDLSWNRKTGLSAPVQFAPTWPSYLFAAGCGIILTAVGMLAPKGKTSIITFSLMYATTFVALLLWRAAYI